MSLITTGKSVSNIPTLEPGTYPAVCYGLIDIGDQYSETFKKTSPQVIIMWEMPGETITIDGEEKPRVISQTYTSSLNERANLRRCLELWRNKPFTPEELAGFDLKCIVGAPFLLTIINREFNGRTYASLGGISSIPKGLAKPTGTMPRVVFDLDSDPLEKMNELPEWVQERIRKSETYKERLAGIGHGSENAELHQFSAEELLDDEEDLPF